MSLFGHMISSGGIIIDPSKIDAVMHWETLKSFTKIKSFIGLVGCYMKFTEGFPKLVLHLTKLSRKIQAYFLMCLVKRVSKNSRRS